MMGRSGRLLVFSMPTCRGRFGFRGIMRLMISLLPSGGILRGIFGLLMGGGLGLS
jgi:hypothetical protein